ncbi:MAG: transcriptional regulator NrdR [Planctomycetota bacterium]|nr:transcriptional regulator NrdR [Planctomycetota bacterium]
MRCPHCSADGSKVIDSRWSEDTNTTRRRRKCDKCGHRFTSYERIEQGPLYVVKRDGRRELFSREKIFEGLRRACEKLPVSADELDNLTDKISHDIRESFGREVPAPEIGEHVLAELKQLDPVAFVRFASVYRKFQDINDFFGLLESLVNERTENMNGEKGDPGRN